MIDLTVNGLGGCVNSIDMTLEPCVTRSGDSLAREQLALLRKYLLFTAQRARLLHGRARFELHHDAELALRVADELQRHGADAKALQALGATACRQLSEADSPLAPLEATSAAIRSEVSRTVRSLPAAAAELRRAVEAAVIAHARPLIRFQRAWYAPQGWESQSEALPSVESLLSLPPRQ